MTSPRPGVPESAARTGGASAPARDRGAPGPRRVATAAVAVVVVTAWVVQFTTIPRMKWAFAGTGTAPPRSLSALAALLSAGDLACIAAAVAALVALAVCEIRFRTVTRAIDAALDGERGPRLVVFGAVGLLAIRSYFDPGVPAQFDGKAHWSRLAAVADALAQGEWPAWTFRFGGGQPVHRVFGPLAYWIPAAIALLPGVGLLLALRLSLAGCHAGASALAASFVRTWTGSRRAGAAAALLLLLAPPRFHSVLGLSRFPEGFVYPAFVLVLLAIERIAARRSPGNIALLGVALAALLLIHPAVGLSGCVVAAAWGIVRFAAAGSAAGVARNAGAAACAAALAAGLVAFHVVAIGGEKDLLQTGLTQESQIARMFPAVPKPAMLAGLLHWQPLSQHRGSHSYIGVVTAALALLGLVAMWRSGRRAAAAAFGAALFAALDYTASHYFGSRAILFVAVLTAAGAGAFVASSPRGALWILLALADMLPFSIEAPFRPGAGTVESRLSEVAAGLPGQRFVVFGVRGRTILGSQYQTGGASGLPVAGCPLPEEATAHLPWQLAATARVEDDVAAGRPLSHDARRAMRLTGISGIVLEDGRDLVAPPAAVGPGTHAAAEGRAVVLDAPAPFVFSTALAPAGGLPPRLRRRISTREVPLPGPERIDWNGRIEDLCGAFGIEADRPVAARILVEDARGEGTEGVTPGTPVVRRASSDDVRISFDAEFPSDGWIAVTCAWHPGIEVRIDGTPVPVLRSAITTPVVAVAAGSRTVEVTGPSLPVDRRGFLVTGLAIACVAGLFALDRRRRP